MPNAPSPVDEILRRNREAQAQAAALQTTNPTAPQALHNTWDYWKQVAENAPHSLANAASGLYQTVRHPVNTAGALLDTAAGGLRNVVGAVSPSLQHYVDQQSDPASVTRAQATAHAMAQHVARYKHPDVAFKEDPVGTIADLSALLSGGAGALARIAPTAAETLSRAAAVTNPVNAAVKAARMVPGVKPLVTAVAKPFVKTATVLDDSGALTPEATAAIEQSGIHPDAFDPALLNRWSDLAVGPDGKGVSAASAREALLRHVGAPEVTRGVTVGEQASKAAPEAGIAMANAKMGVTDSAAAKAPDIKGLPIGGVASEAPIGQSFVNSALEAKSAVPKAYAKASKHPGVFEPDTVDSFLPTVQEVLKGDNYSGLPATVDRLRTSGYLPMTKEVLFGGKGSSGLIGQLSDLGENTRTLIPDLDHGVLPTRSTAPDTLTMSGIETVRKEITNAYRRAEGDDVAGLNMLSKALDTWTAKAIEDGKFSGDGNTVLQDLAAARKAHSDFMSTFPQHPNPVVRAAWGKVKNYVADDGTLMPTAPGDMPVTVEQTITNGIAKPGSATPVMSGDGRPFGAQTYQEISSPRVEGGPAPLTDEGISALQDHLRGNAYTGQLSRENLNQILGGSFGALFSPEDQVALRQHTEANDLLNTPTSQLVPSSLDSVKHPLRRVGLPVVGASLGAAFGNAASHFLPALPPGILAYPASGAGLAVGNAIDRTLALREGAARSSAEMAGAPTAPVDLSALSAVPAPLNAASRISQVPQQPEEQLAPSGPPQPLTKAQLDTAFSSAPGNVDQPEGRAAPEPKPLSSTDLSAAFAHPGDLGEPDKHAAGGRAGYKSGGKVAPKDIEHLVRRLMHKTKQAKKVSDKATEPLLNAHDNAIASALAVAQKAI